ncbi:unnamed protein product [Orchesella dallaii]|uniref:G-protein coupled receptors family 1 profile domain-containing protein n=1 Tax=Orchesella dallaii TaxID=48710 RepID=A0ABP1PZS9_9HEXA
MEMINGTHITELLVYYTCLIIDLPEENGKPKLQDCSTTNGTSSSRIICVECNIASKFWDGEAVTDVRGMGHLISFLLWLVIVITGLFGIVTNFLIIIVLKGRNCKGTKFNFLLSVLAVYDLISCFSSILATTSFIACFMGWSTCGSRLSSYFIQISQSAMFFSRTLSIYMTIFITIHCYLGIAYPLRTRKWFSWTKTRMVPLLVLFISILLNGPKAIASFVDKRVHHGAEEDIQSLSNIPYVSRWREEWLQLWYKGAFVLLDFLDFTLPLPTFLVFNFLSYRKMN